MKQFEFYISAEHQWRSAIYTGQDLHHGWRVGAIHPDIHATKLGTDSHVTVSMFGENDLYKISVSGDGDYFDEGISSVLRKMFSNPELHFSVKEPYCEFRLDSDFDGIAGNMEKVFRVKDFQEFLNHFTTRVFSKGHSFSHFTRRNSSIISHLTNGSYKVIGRFIGTCTGFEDLPEFISPHSV